MKVKFAAWLVLAMCAFLTPAGAAPAAGGATPALAKPAAANGTNEVTPPKPPGDIYTNIIDMVLLKTPAGFWTGKYEVTQKEYQKVAGSNPSQFAGETRPVDSVSWNDAMEFCRKLTAQDSKELPPGFYYTLPTEDEWQGLMADAKLDDAVTSMNTPRGGTSPVGSLGPNSLGLYDMRGNVMEFCLGDDSKPYRVLHGGSWEDFIEVNLRPAFRFYCMPDEHKNTFGFRCILKQK
jgi:formylglycine-generating enzyme required for sulfatase activity